jgi:hypothetical protein
MDRLQVRSRFRIVAKQSPWQTPLNREAGFRMAAEHKLQAGRATPSSLNWDMAFSP